MPTDKKKKIGKEIEGYFFMLIACVAYALSTDLFLAKNSIVAGGVTGLSVLIHLLNEKIPIGMISIAINLPILVLGLRLMGWKFILKGLLTITC